MQNFIEAKKFEQGSKNEAFSDWENYFSSENDELLFSRYHNPVENSQIMNRNGLHQDISKREISIKVLSWKNITPEDMINLHEYEVTQDIREDIAVVSPESTSSNSIQVLQNEDESKSKENSYQESYGVTISEDGSDLCSVQQQEPFCTNKDSVQKNLDIDFDATSIIDENFERNIMAIFDQDFLFGGQSQNTSRNQELCKLFFNNNTLETQHPGNKAIPASSEDIPGTQEMTHLSQDISGTVEMINSSQDSYRNQTMLISSPTRSRNQEMCILTQCSSYKEVPVSSQVVSGTQEMINSSQDSSGTVEMINSSQESYRNQTMLIPSPNSSRNQEMCILTQCSGKKEIPVSSQVVCGSQGMINSSQGSSGTVEMIISSQESYGSQTMIVSSQESTGSETMVVSSQVSSSGETMMASSQDSKNAEKMIVSSQESAASPKMMVLSQESLENMKMVSSQESLESQKMNVTSLENAVSSHELFADQILGVPNSGGTRVINPYKPNIYINKEVCLSRRKQFLNKFKSHDFNVRKCQKSNKYYLKPRKYLKSKFDSLTP